MGQIKKCTSACGEVRYDVRTRIGVELMAVDQLPVKTDSPMVWGCWWN